VPYIKSGEIKIYYEEQGVGTPLVFLHGFSLDRRMWQGQIDYFSDRYRIISYDARGHGKSDAPETNYSREDRVSDLLALVDNLKLDRFHLVGLSMGGGDALRFAIDYQDRLISLTLAGSTASGWKAPVHFRDIFSEDKNRENIENIKQRWIDSTLSNYEKRNPELKEILAEMMSDFSGKPWSDPKAGQYEKTDDIRLAAKIRIPTLLIAGQRDISFRPLAVKLSEIILDSRLEVVKEVGHMVNMEALDIFNKHLENFLLENEIKK